MQNVHSNVCVSEHFLNFKRAQQKVYSKQEVHA